MANTYKLGAKTAELLARVIVLRDLKESGKLDLKYGKKNELQDILGCGAMAPNRSLSALDEIEPEVDRLKSMIDPWDKAEGRLDSLLNLSRQRYADMKSEQAKAIPFEMYEQILRAEGLPA